MLLDGRRELKKKGQSLSFLFIIIFSPVFFYSCASNTDYFKQVDSYVHRSDYDTALYMIENNEKELYTNKDLVLKSLDKGLLAHYSGRYHESNEALSLAEQYMFEYFSKSISQSIQSFIVNDTLIDYAGDPYEDIYSNLFMALNYIALGEIDEALVEIRRFDTKQKNLSANYQNAQGKVSQDLSKDIANQDAYFGTMTFHNSALARYLSMLLYRADGNMDAAEIDLRYLKTAFRDQSQLYPFSLPQSLEEELLNRPNLARLNILAFTGLAPTKEEEAIRFYSGSTYFKLALPIMLNRNSRVSVIDVEIESIDTGERFRLRLEPLEQIDLIANETFKQKQNLLYFKAIARAIAKSMTTSVLDTASRLQEDSNASTLLSLLSLASMVSNELTEVADLRTSRYFPAKASVGGIHLPLGFYTIRVQYLDPWGSLIKKDEIFDYELKKNTIHLVEAICLE